MMWTVLRIEIKKMLNSKGFLVATSAGIVVAIIQFYWFYKYTYLPNQYLHDWVLNADYRDPKYANWFEKGILEGWIGCESYSPYNQMFFLAFPLLAAVPFGVSLCNEWRSGYASQVIIRCGRKRYFASKFIAVFTGGGMAVAIPLLANLLIAACFLPAIPIDPLSLQAGIRGNDMFGALYYENPVGYALCYVGIDFIFGGLFGCMTLVVSRWMNNRFTAVCFPLMFQCMLIYGVDKLLPNCRQYNPVFYINPDHMVFSLECNAGLLFALIGGLLIVLIGLYMMGNYKIEAMGRR